ncbi:MAG: dipeptide epimerase [Armatimonadetes bacterium]|nr:dipeptide epimerase [Armatimonadota bacterium]
MSPGRRGGAGKPTEGARAPIAWTRTTLIERAASSLLNTSYGEAEPTRPHVILEIGGPDGLVGLGEASPLPMFTGETVPGIQRILEEVYLPALIGKDATRIDAIMAEMDEALPENRSAKAAIDVALHDLAGKTLGVPVSTLLGGARRPSIALACAVGIDAIDVIVERCAGFVRAGFNTLKMKVGKNWSTDVERVRAVRAAVGMDVRIRIDANQGYDAPTAIRVLRALEDCRLDYMEQPVAQDDLAGLAHVRRSTGMRILVDESVHTPRDAMNLIAAQAADLFAIKLIKTGGMARARQIANIGAAAGIGCIVISPFETQIGCAAGLHLAVALPIAEHACELTAFATQAEMAVTSVRLEGEQMVPGDVPGLGVDSIVEIEKKETVPAR